MEKQTTYQATEYTGQAYTAALNRQYDLMKLAWQMAQDGHDDLVMKYLVPMMREREQDVRQTCEAM